MRARKCQGIRLAPPSALHLHVGRDRAFGGTSSWRKLSNRLHLSGNLSSLLSVPVVAGFSDEKPVDNPVNDPRDDEAGHEDDVKDSQSGLADIEAPESQVADYRNDGKSNGRAPIFLHRVELGVEDRLLRIGEGTSDRVQFEVGEGTH